MKATSTRGEEYFSPVEMRGLKHFFPSEETNYTSKKSRQNLVSYSQKRSPAGQFTNPFVKAMVTRRFWTPSFPLENGSSQ
jgi:hypothetical protein